MPPEMKSVSVWVTVFVLISLFWQMTRVCPSTVLTRFASSPGIPDALTGLAHLDHPASPHLDSHLGCGDPFSLYNSGTTTLAPDLYGHLVSPNPFPHPRVSPDLLTPPPRLLFS